MTTPDPEATARDVHVAQRHGSDVQFAPGTLVAGRYRIASILGKGGMGEVYRADDIKLGQTVALKFLPARLALDEKLLQHLHDEVRLGRQVAHPNVCRIYDIGTWGDAHFIAMEYVDGEDLARLLHRIGRLPHDKAVDISRGIAAGLSAAHAKGILHRDLKPANVLIDSQGDARITDFGLALADDADQNDISGTPAYMAPEQLEGGAATIQSDLYALGLVMYEIFTGKRLYSGGSLQELRREKSSEITTPSDIIRDIDPAIERLILRCLARDPAQRPRSAREVIAALPGGDPLAAALAAGETPSPKLVAAAGSEGTLSRRAAWTMLAAIAVLFAGLYAIRRATDLSRYVSFDRSPEVLRQRAGEILHQLGIAARDSPIAHFYSRREYFAWLMNSRRPAKWEALRNGPQPLLYHLEYGFTPEQSRVTNTRTTSVPGNTAIAVDPLGRLAFLLAPPGAPVKPRPLDWSPLLDATGVDVSSLRTIPPQHTPAAPFDARAAWSGTYPGDTTPIHVEAAAWQGRPVFLRVTGVWDEVADPFARLAFAGGADLFVAGVSVIVVVSAMLLAWRNLRLRRGDRQGAFRFAITYFAIDATARLLMADYPSRLLTLIGGIWQEVLLAAGGAVVWYALYIALEPYARRKWPEQLISWTRLLSGRVRDPMVGRDVLIGVLCGLVHGILSFGGRLLALWLSAHEPVPFIYVIGRHLSGFRYELGTMLSILIFTVTEVLAVLMMLVLWTIILRKRAAAMGALFLVALTYFMLGVAGQPELVPVYAAVAAWLTFVVVRFGVITCVAMQTTFFGLFNVITGSSPWLVALSAIPVVFVVALALWGFRVSLGSQSVWHPDLLDG